MIWVVAIVCIVITVIVVFLSILTLDKGYGYKHKVDPLPTNIEGEQDSIENKEPEKK